MNTLLRNLFPFKGFKVSVLENGNRVLLGLKSRRITGNCPCCGKRCRDVETEYERTVRDLDLCQRKSYLQFKQKKIRCNCSYRGLEMLDFVSKSRRVTNRMELFCVSLCEKMSIKEACSITGLNWKTMKEIDRDYIKSLLPDIAKLIFSRIALDEIAIAKGHQYVTIIRDYDTGVVIKIVPSRKYESVKQGLVSLGKDKLEKVQVVCLDMWEAYIKAINETMPDAKLVFDKFHVVKKVNEAVDRVRKKEFAEADNEERLLMKRKRFIILSKESNLNSLQREELSILMKKNEKLYKAYLLKEQIISIFDDKKSSYEQIEKRLLSWMENVLTGCFEEFYEVVGMVRQFFYGIMNYFKYGMTNAISEGFNTKINVIKRRAFGFRDVEYFMLKIIQNSLKRFA